MNVTLAEIAGMAGGQLLGGDPDTVVSSYSIDTRTLDPGALFVALRAERDGHDFVADALDKGAAGALVSRLPSAGPTAAAGGAAPFPPGEGIGLVLVDDTATALTALGREARARLADVPVIGITGSTGKTSTKDLTAAALAPAGPVGASPVSFNNEIGVPLTLLSAPPGAVAVVVEMGARGIGHIATLAAVARPTIGVITNIGMAHAEFFGSREEVARGKGELLEALPADGHAVLSADDDMTPGLRARTSAAVLTAGTSAGADVRVSAVQLDGELRPAFHLDTPWGSADVPPLPVRGAHQAGNAAFAVAIAGIVGVGLADVVAGLAGAVGSPLRMELRRSPAGLIVLNDSYNANPTSMAAAVDALAGLGRGRRFAVLGQMAELGPHAAPEHHRLGKLVAAAGVETLVVVAEAPPGRTVGDTSAELAALAEGARENGVEAVVVSGPQAAVDALTPRLRPGDAVLVKASRVAGLEQVAAILLDWSPGGPGVPPGQGRREPPEKGSVS